MIGPIGVQHPQLGESGLPPLFPKIGLAEGQIVPVHGETHLRDHLLQPRRVLLAEALQHSHRLGSGVLNLQGIKGLQRGLSGLHGVDDIAADAGNVLRREVPIEGIDPGGAHQGPLPLGEQLDTLGRRVGPLVKLAGEVFHGEEGVGIRGERLREVIQLRLGEDRPPAYVEESLVDALYIIAIDEPDPLQPRDAEKFPDIPQQPCRFLGQSRLFFHVNTINHGQFSLFFAASARRPMSRRKKAFSKWMRPQRA